jgi:hypothetical protein
MRCAVEYGFFIQKFSKVEPLHGPPDYRPTLVGFHLGQAHQQQRQPTDQHIGADLALIQYRDGATDYTTVLTAQTAPLAQQGSLATGQGDVPQGLITVYRALGGGWEIREGKSFLPADVTTAMGNRTDWGGLLEPAAVEPQTERQLLTPDW